jgi:ferredoxin-NADP reductase
MFPARISAIRQETPTIKSFVLECPAPDFEFLPGQWLDLHVELGGHDAVGGYSMINAPRGDGRIELAVKHSDTHAVTRYLHEQARVGDCVSVSNGSGTFYYRRSMGDRVVLIGAGVGVTPLLSIMRHIQGEEPDVDVTLLYSVAVPEEILFAEELAQMNLERENTHLLITVTQPQGSEWTGLTGRIDADKLAEAGLSQDTVYFICGPGEMVDNTARMLLRLGIPEPHVVYEKWW